MAYYDTHFNVITAQKQLAKKALLNSQSIVNMLVNTGNNVREFETVDTGSKSPAAKLIKTHFWVPDTIVEDKNFITMRSSVLYTDSNVVREIGFSIYIICNNDQIDLLQGSRSDLLADAVDRILNNGDTPLFGLGGIELDTANEVQFNSYYSGWELPYITHERNREAKILG